MFFSDCSIQLKLMQILRVRSERVVYVVIMMLTCCYFLLQLFTMRLATLIKIFVILIKIAHIQTDGEFLYFTIFSVFSKRSR